MSMKELYFQMVSLHAAISETEGVPAVDRFTDIGEVRLKIAEFRSLLTMLTTDAAYLVQKFDADSALNGNDPAASLGALLRYLETTLRLLRDDVIHFRGRLAPMPDLDRLAAAMPGLGKVLADRWREAQICRNTGCHIAAVMLIGTILEALLLSRASEASTDLHRARHAPMTASGQLRPLQEWNLTELIAVALELGWLTAAPRNFPAALRKFRSLIHPWEQVSSKMKFDAALCEKCWQVMIQSVDDLIRSR